MAQIVDRDGQRRGTVVVVCRDIEQRAQVVVNVGQRAGELHRAVVLPVTAAENQSRPIRERQRSMRRGQRDFDRVAARVDVAD